MDCTTWRRVDAWGVLFSLVFPSVATWVYFILLAPYPAGPQQAAWLVGKVVQFAFPVVWVLGMQRRRLRLSRPNIAGLGEGFLFGLLVFAVMLGAYHAWFKPAGYLAGAEQAVARKVSAFGIRGLPAYVALGVFYSVAHSFLEEYYWRWFAFGQLRQLIPWKTAVVVSSLGFTAHHVLVLATYFGWFSLATWGFSLAVAVGGAAWAWIYQRSGSLYGPWLSHLVVDAAIFVVGYDMVAGGWVR